MTVLGEDLVPSDPCCRFIKLWRADYSPSIIYTTNATKLAQSPSGDILPRHKIGTHFGNGNVYHMVRIRYGRQLAKAAQISDDRVAAYLAGLFDGEGCVSIAAQKGGTKSKGLTYFPLHIKISNNDGRALAVARSWTGGWGSIYRCKNSFTWQMRELEAFQFLASIYRFTRIKALATWLGLCFAMYKARRRYHPREEWLETETAAKEMLMKINQMNRHPKAPRK